MLVAGGMLNYADRQIIAVLKPLLQQDLHWSDGDYGSLTAVFQLSSAMALLGSGWLVDRIGWRRANPISVGAWSLAAMAHAAARSFPSFLLARASLGATEALGTPTAVKTIAAVFSIDDRALALGIMNAANTAGAVATPLLIPLIAASGGWPLAFLAAGGLGLLWVAAWLLLRPGGDDRKAQASPRSAQGRGDHWLVVVKDRRTWAVAGAKVLSDQVWWLLLFWTPDLFHRVFHLSVAAFGPPLAVIYGCAGVGSLASGYVSTRLLRSGMSLNKARKLVLVTLAVLAAPVLLTPYVPNYWIATAILGLTLAAHQGFSVTIFALATDISPSARLATVISIGALCGNLGGMVILQAAGWVLGAGYGYGPLLALASISYLLAVGWVQWLLPKIRPAEPSPPGPASLPTPTR